MDWQGGQTHLIWLFTLLEIIQGWELSEHTFRQG
jgi:hypothetical protein